MGNIHLLIIDPQNDFCNPDGALFVKGADQDMKNLATFINHASSFINEIHVSLDSHRTIDIAHPIFWINDKGEHPNPFTIIGVDDVKKGIWMATRESWRVIGLTYVEALAENGRYPLCIWPPHCIIGTYGHSIVKDVSDALIKWENDRFGVVDYISKGSNICTEHYSAYKADVAYHSDPSTLPNKVLLKALTEADEIIVAGEALSHCVRNTVQDLITDMPEGSAKKFVLLRNATSSVSSFEKMGDDFISEMTTKGMRLTDTGTRLLSFLFI